MSQKGKNTSEIVTNQKNVLEVYLAEWAMLLPEQQASVDKQGNILSLAITEVFVLLGFVGAVTNFDALNEFYLASLNCVLIPCVFMLTGGLWMDAVYRQMSLASYLHDIETKVNAILMLSGENLIGREHYIGKKNKGVPFVLRANHWYHYVCLFFFIFCPWATIVFHCFIFNKPWFDWCYITFGIYSLFIVFFVSYCARIYQIKSVMNH